MENMDSIVANFSVSGLISQVSNLCTATANLSCNATPSDSGVAYAGVYVRGGVAYLQLVGYILVDFVGVVGNLFVLGVVALCKDMRTVANYFIISLSVADLLVSLIVIPIVTATRWLRVWSLGSPFCDFVAIINHTCMAASIFNLAAIAVNRLIITRMPGRYKGLFSKSQCGLYITIAWFFAFLYALLPAFGWGKFEYDNVRYACVYSRDAAPSYSIFFAIFCVLIPQVICGLCYLMILITFKRSRETLEQFPGVNVSGNAAMSERKLTKNLLVVWIAFVLCWLPTMTLLFVDPKGVLNEGVYTFAVWMMFCNSCLNPIIYGLVNRRFRSGYIQLIKKASLHKKCRKLRITPTETLSRPACVRPMPDTSNSLQVNVISRSSGSDSVQGPPGSHLTSGLVHLDVPRKVIVHGRFIEPES